MINARSSVTHRFVKSPDEDSGSSIGILGGSASLFGERGANSFGWNDQWSREYSIGAGWQNNHVKVLRSTAVGQNLKGIKLIKPNQREAEAQEEKERYEAKQALIKTEDIIKARCDKEFDRMFQWFNVGVDTVQAGYDKVAKGMFYGIEFPWSEKTMAEFGPKWLTQAMQITGYLDNENSVTKVICKMDKSSDIDAGNNGAKFLFACEFKYKSPHLCPKLFAKIPYPMGGVNQTDRISSSVYKQPMDMKEIDTYRLMESRFPFKIPRFVYGDISNETTNFILLLEQLPFKGFKDGKPIKCKPYEVEGCYEKCKDYMLPSPQEEYYRLLMIQSGKLAGWFKAHKLCPNEEAEIAMSQHPDPNHPEMFGMNPVASSGMKPPPMLANDIKTAQKFIGTTAKVLFPKYVQDPDFLEELGNTWFKLHAYAAEINYYSFHNLDYVAAGHQNLNMDNAFFWRDEDGKLDCGMLDFGGFSSTDLPRKMWWCLNCSEFSNLANLDEYVDIFIEAYHEHGGPLLDHLTFKRLVCLRSFEAGLQMAQAIPNCLKQCPLREWDTIKDIFDPRVSSNVHGKSTLRTTLQVLVNVVRAFQELDWKSYVEDFIHNVYAAEMGGMPKTEAMYLP